MKRFVSICFTGFALLVALASCQEDCEPVAAACNEQPPTDEACQAAFSRWFYNEEQNRCELITYSGCSQKGFATQAECHTCACN
jgi:hypothetical protein